MAKKYKIAVGKSRKDTHWHNDELSWAELLDRLQTTIRTAETVDAYKNMSKDLQSEIKDVGGFVGGHLRTGRRLKNNIDSRSMLTLDIDFLPSDAQSFWASLTNYDADLMRCVYSTHKHVPDSPRLRLLVPLDRDVTPDEYEAIARLYAEDIGIDYFDDTTYQASRLMYWPSTSVDGEYYFDSAGDSPLCADDMLARYADWHDVSSWPISSRVTKQLRQTLAEQEDPSTKQGIVGAFCRTYDIPDAIDTFLGDVYTEFGKERYTYVPGSTSGGLVLYGDGKFAYSNHGTDPAAGQLCNAFDLVRLHLFGDKDKGSKATNITHMPSYVAMCDLAVADKQVKRQLAKERASAAQDFAGEDLTQYADEDTSWQDNLELSKKGKILPTRDNLVIILEHDPVLKDAIAFNQLEGVEYIKRSLPWHKLKRKAIPEPVREVDDAAMRRYIEKTYELDNVRKIEDALHIVAEKNAYHPVKEYLDELIWDGIPRVETLLIDYLGAEDTDYVRAVTRKTLAAAVRRIYQPGCKFDYMLTLYGPQGSGKSTLARELGRQWFSDSISSVQGKDSYEQLNGVWIAEMGELNAMKKAEAEAVKLYISKQTDRYRAAYAHRVEDHPRQNIFIGTTNDRQFLRDNTGGRRFWIVSTTGYTDKQLTQDIIDQIWAEAVEINDGGESLYLNSDLESQAAEIQEGFRAEDQRQGMIKEYLDIPLPNDWMTRSIDERCDYIQNKLGDGDGTLTAEGAEPRQRVCALEIWCELFGKDKGAMAAYESKAINDMLDGIDGWERYSGPKKFPKPYGIQRGFYRV